MRKTIVMLCAAGVAAVIIIAGVLIANGRPHATAPSLLTGMPVSQGGGRDPGDESALESSANDAVVDALDKATGSAKNDSRRILGKTVAQWKAEARAGEEESKAAASDIIRKRCQMARALTPYHVAKPDLTRDVISKYGPITSQRVDDLVAVASGLEEDFWKAGDFDNQASFESVYEARALLEAVLHVDPQNEAALKQLCDVIQAGWPNFEATGLEASLRCEVRQRKMDWASAMWTLWDACLSKRAANNPEDMLYACDLIFATPKDIPRDETLASQFAALNPAATDTDVGVFFSGLPDSRRHQVAEWALAGARAKGPDWSCYADVFAQVTSPGKIPQYRVFVEDRTPGASIADRFRFMLGRGWSFIGPKERARYLVPLHEQKRGPQS